MEIRQKAAMTRYGGARGIGQSAPVRGPVDGAGNHKNAANDGESANHEMQIRRLTAERDAARMALAQAREGRVRTIANLSHELRTPLNAIVGFSDLMRAGTLGRIQPVAYQTYIESMYQAGLHLVELLDAVLDMARIGAQEMPLHESEVDPARLVGSVASMLRGAARLRDIRLVRRGGKGLPMIRVDERMMRQMLINLVGNAIKYAPASTTVTLAARVERGGGFVFEVHDQGAGLTPEQIETVMHPFRQLADSAEAAWHGTGLGLPLVRAQAQLHDGDLTLCAPAGGGTTAMIRLPGARVVGSGTARQPEFSFTRSSALQ